LASSTARSDGAIRGADSGPAAASVRPRGRAAGRGRRRRTPHAPARAAGCRPPSPAGARRGRRHPRRAAVPRAAVELVDDVTGLPTEQLHHVEVFTVEHVHGQVGGIGGHPKRVVLHRETDQETQRMDAGPTGDRNPVHRWPFDSRAAIAKVKGCTVATLAVLNNGTPVQRPRVRRVARARPERRHKFSTNGFHRGDHARSRTVAFGRIEGIRQGRGRGSVAKSLGNQRARQLAGGWVGHDHPASVGVGPLQ
jgi:hypothetical protein